MQPDPYAPDKLMAHVDAIPILREGGSALRSVHLMVQNRCNHSCDWCSYRLITDSGAPNKNASAFNEGVHIPVDALDGLLDDFLRLGVQGVEVTGGGEPMAYPDIPALWGGLNSRGFRTALVTNGTLVRNWAPLVTERMAWARVSIDAGHAKTYAATRKCPERHFAMAWEAVGRLREAADAHSWPDFKLGVGFVMDKNNHAEIEDFVRIAADSGADNVRLASTYSDDGMARFDGLDVARIIESSRIAENIGRERGITVHNLLPKRLNETERAFQDYPRCYAKDMLCVVEGEGKVYTCCTFTGSDKGLQGNFLTHPEGFYGVWRDADGFRRGLDPRTYCQIACLYEERNKRMAKIVEADTMLHKEFV